MSIKQLTHMTLPEPHKVNKRKTQFISGPCDNSTYSPSQLIAFDSLVSVALAKSKTVAQLVSHAGYGKTYITSEIIKELLWRDASLRIAVIAMTHQAIAVIAEDIGIKHSNLGYHTSTSFFGESLVREGLNEVFRQTKPAKDAMYDVIIVDEASMTNKKYAAHFKKLKKTIIYVGDDGQLRPVKEPKSAVLQDGYADLRFTLATNMRQGSESAVADVANAYRLEGYGVFDSLPELIVRGKSSVRLMRTHSSEGVKDEVYSLIDDYFLNEHYRKSSRYCKVLCYRNTWVNRFNKYIRLRIFEDAPEVTKIMQGEKLIATKAMLYDDEMLIKNGESLNVLSLNVEELEFNGVTISYYETIVSKDNGERIGINIVHEQSEAAHIKMLKTLKLAASSAKDNKKALENAYYNYRDFFMTFNYAYASTVHKAQGSTFTNTFVMMVDLNICMHAEERQELIYTALSRAAVNSFLVW
jgi:exodeoxyribonuclease-5